MQVGWSPAQLGARGNATHTISPGPELLGPCPRRARRCSTWDPPTLRRCSSSSCMRSCSLRTITCRFHSGMGRPCSSWLGTSASTSTAAPAPAAGTGELPFSTGSGEPPARQRGGPAASGVAGGVGVLVGDGEDTGDSACGGREGGRWALAVLCCAAPPAPLAPGTTYVGPCLAAAGEDGGEAFALRRWLEALPSFDLGQQLRVVAGGGHHVEGLGA